MENSKEKQIEEITTLTSIIWEANHKRSVLDYYWLATEVYNAGYRKASDVAREIFEEIEREIRSSVEVIIAIKDEEEDGWYDGELNMLGMLGRYIAELKKKYESEKDDADNNR